MKTEIGIHKAGNTKDRQQTARSEERGMIHILPQVSEEVNLPKPN